VLPFHGSNQFLKGVRRNTVSKDLILNQILSLDRSHTRAELESHSIPELKTYLGVVREHAVRQQVDEELAPERAALAELQRQAAADGAWVHILRTVVNGRRLVDNAANRQVVFGWLHEDQGEQPTVAWFKNVLDENPALAKSVTWETADPVVHKQEVAAQLAQDRQTFAEAARKFRVGENEANFGIVRSTLGEGFSVYQVQQAAQSGSVRLSPANQAELDKWKSEEIEQRNQFLSNTDVSTLRAAARQEAANRQTEAEKQVVLDMQAQQRRDAAMDFPSLPGTWQGQKLDAAFIRRCDVPTQKLLAKRFGSAQLNARLQVVAKGDSK